MVNTHYICSGMADRINKECTITQYAYARGISRNAVLMQIKRERGYLPGVVSKRKLGNQWVLTVDVNEIPVSVVG